MKHLGTSASSNDIATKGQLPVGYASARLLADAAFTNTPVTLASVTIPANTLVAGAVYEFQISGSVINTTAASNLVQSLLVNGVVVASATVALGTTAFASPGRGFECEGMVTFRAIGSTGSEQPAVTATVSGLAAVVSNVTAPIAINTTAAVTVALQISTSAATSTGTVRQACLAAIP